MPPGTPRQHIVVCLPIHDAESAEVQGALRDVLRKLSHVQGWVRSSDGAVVVRFVPGGSPIERVVSAVRAAGLHPAPERCHRVDEQSVGLTVEGVGLARRRAAGFTRVRSLVRGAWSQDGIPLIVVGGVLLVIGYVLEVWGVSNWVAVPILIASGVLTSTRTAPEAVESLRGFRVNIDILMFAAAIGAVIIGHAPEGALLLFLFGLGSAGEHAAMARAKAAIESLSDLAPERALLVGEDGSVTAVTPEDVSVGDLVRVPPYERVPVDGEIVKGTTEIDASAVTGEPIPVTRGVGDAVVSGTMNTTAAVDVRVTAHASQSTLARIMALVEEAQENRSPAQSFAEGVERWYVPLVFVSTAVLLVAQPMLIAGVGWGEGFYRAMAFLTAASPCAIAIGTPSAVLCALARSARIGVLVKGGGSLAALAQCDVMAFDKTGTLTPGKPQVVASAVEAGYDRARVFAQAAAVEHGISHPIAQAIVEAMGDDAVAASDIRQIPGQGVEGVVDGETVSVVKPAAYTKGLSAELQRVCDESRAEGATLAIVVVEGVAAGVIALRDMVRSDSAEAIRRLKALGIERTVMLTGDHESAAKPIAEQCGIDEYAAALTPQEKLERIRGLGDRVAMVGDGVNDAPALAEASVGISMGAGSSGVALETADIALMGNNLSRLPEAYALAKRSEVLIRQNLALALLVILVMAPAAGFGYAPLGLAVLFHEGSTILVVLNSLRLLRDR